MTVTDVYVFGTLLKFNSARNLHFIKISFKKIARVNSFIIFCSTEEITKGRDGMHKNVNVGTRNDAKCSDVNTALKPTTGTKAARSVPNITCKSIN